MGKTFFASVTRISDLPNTPFTLEELDRRAWQTGDYVAGEVLYEPGTANNCELTDGRTTTVFDGDVIIGSLGSRAATLEAVGDWREVTGDLRLEALTAAGVLGKCTSRSQFIAPLLPLRYLGHVAVRGAVRNMRDYALPLQRPSREIPVILIIGTSMDAGKTLTARVMIRLLKERGHRVGGVKFCGVGRFRDVLAMRDAGADFVCDFMDAGLPSTCCPKEEFQGSTAHLLALLRAENVDVIVGEAGASPMEPYNGDSVLAELGGQVCATILCASDPYAVVGVMNAFEKVPDLVAGRATSTSASIDLVHKLCRVQAINVLERSTWPALAQRLEDWLSRDWPSKKKRVES